MEINILESRLDRRYLHELFMSCVSPRPIAWVSTVGENGVANLAPFSAYAILCLRPATLCFNVGYKRDFVKKDTLRNIEASGEFVVNVVTEELIEPMNISCADFPPEVSEFEKARVTPVASSLVKPPRVAESPVNMECRLNQIIRLGEAPDGGNVVLGTIVYVHIKDGLWDNEVIEPSALKAVGRMGGDFYCRTTGAFSLKRPG